ncbi:MAG: aspartate aminotransferase family protein [Actinomycetia bacterium]|nr:aspartate aminotransferase family protein [Actinomycetes bacterium]MCP4227705.1 aspartate aminotransferase family protein [Actinomycetes bacterium]MCP5034198.1 aspartate aminotransferase family protein [Actinomycetes bacterium]
MDTEEFRAAGHDLIDWIADYRATLDNRAVKATTGPGEVAAALPMKPPTGTDSIGDLISDLDAIVVPGMTQVQHPMHYGWFPSNASLASVLGDLASSGLGGLGISWESCPALTEVEEVVCDWMRQLTGLSDAWSGTIHDTASTSCLVAMLIARERATGHSQIGGGLTVVSAAPVVYCTVHAHSSVRKAALLAGYGSDHLHLVDDDPETFAMDPGALARAMADDRAAGRVPAAVVASVGTTGTTAFDPLPEIVAVAGEHGAWVHVDAAMAGTAMLLDDYRHLWDGVEGADSITWNPHKWMGTILDTSLFYIRDVEHLIRVMSTNPSYLRSTVDGEVTQYRDWGVPLGRRFRSLKLWFHLRLDGADAIRARIRRDLDNTAWLAGQVEAHPDWELVAPVPLQTVCVRHRPAGLDSAELEAHTQRWVQAINDSGQAYLTPSLLRDSWMVRVSIGVETTEQSHVEALWALMNETAEQCLAATGSPGAP